MLIKGINMEKFCKSCGMPMDRSEDFANNDINSDYCYYCGERGSYEEKDEKYFDSSLIEKEEYYKKKGKKLKKKSTTKIKSKKKSKAKK